MRQSISPRMYNFLFGDRDPVREPGTETGTPGNWWTVFALVPDCFDHAVEGFRFYRSPRRELSPELRELGQTRAGYARGSQFVFSQHCKAMRSLGFSEAQIAAIPHWQAADCFDEPQRLVLAYTDCLVLDGGRTPDGANVFCSIEGIQEKIGVRFIKGEEKERLSREQYRLKNVHYVMVQCRQNFPNHAVVKLIWGKGVTSISGVKTTSDQVLTFRTAIPLKPPSGAKGKMQMLTYAYTADAVQLLCSCFLGLCKEDRSEGTGKNL